MNDKEIDSLDKSSLTKYKILKKTWEYQILQLTDDSEDPEYMTQQDRIDFLGKEGWELVSVDNRVAYFKRPK